MSQPRRRAGPLEDVPGWVTGLTEAQLRAVLGSGAVSRGAAYARSGAVTSLTVTDGGRSLVAKVAGSGGQRYSTVVMPSGAGRLNGRCSCPVGVNCKHVAAVLLTARAAARPAASMKAATPPWEERLAGLLQDGAQVGGAALGLQLEVAAPTAAAGGARVRLRPVRRVEPGRWVRAGAAWRDLEHGYGAVRLPARPRAALRALHAAWRASQPAWMPTYREPVIHLDDVGPSVWRLLAEALDAGVVLLDGQGRPTVRLASAPAEVEVDLRAAGVEGDVSLHLSVRLDDAGAQGQPVLVGRPPSGLYVGGSDGLLLAPFARPLDEVTAGLLGAPPLLLPAADLARFVRRYLPELRRRATVGSRDGSVVLPEPAPPRLALHVRLEAGHVTELAWSFRYRLGDDDVRVPLEGPTEEVARDAAGEQAALDGLADLPDAPGVWTVDQTGRRRPVEQVRLSGLRTARFASQLLPLLQDREGLDVEIELAEEVRAAGAPVYVESAAPPLVQVSARDADGTTDWFDLAVSVTVGGHDVPLAALIAALTAGEDHLLLDGGTWFSLDAPELRALQRLVAEASGLLDREAKGLRVSPYQAGLWEELVELGVVGQTSERWSRTVGGLLGLTELPQPDPPLKLLAELRPYQLEGYRWLSLLWDLQLGGVLADDMGLGKTLQTLAMASRAYERGELLAPLLVVAPTSVVATWAAEAERFCPDLPVVTVTETERRSGVPLAERVAGAALVVTSYALLRLDDDSYLEQPWSGLVLDEAQHVKNPAARTYSVVRRLQAPFALAITGTPLENSLMDLWSLLSITAPGLFPDPQRFSEDYRRPIETGSAPERLAALRRRLRPLVLRRTKEQVAADLPPKVEQVLEVALSPQHRRIYDRHLQRERQRVLGLLDDLQRNRFAILRSLTVLRQLSLDPSLVEDGCAGVGAGKVDVLVEQLRAVAEEGHRALVFSSFTGFLRKVRDRLDAEGIGTCFLDGRTRDRPRRIAEFREGTAPAFLISLKAGGTGLTLTEADYVFVLDPWWNPAVEAQAVDRAHRIGQTRTVMVYRLVATGTIEEKVIALQRKKRELFTAVVDGDGAASAGLTVEDVRALLG